MFCVTATILGASSVLIQRDREEGLLMARLRLAFLVSLFVVLASPADAQVVRTWVSAASGVDGNPCTRSQPCRNFAAAILAVDAGGEVAVLDSGGFGPVDITESVTLVAPEGIHAAIAPTSGRAIGVFAPVVRLRNLFLQSHGGSIGIHAGSSIIGTFIEYLFVEGCTISGFSQFGILFSGVGGERCHIADTVVRDSGSHGIDLSVVTTTLTHVTTEDNGGDGVLVEACRVNIHESFSIANGRHGYAASSFSDLILDSSVAAENAQSGVAALATGLVTGSVVISISRSVISGNTTGISGTIAAQTTRVSDTTITRNTAAISAGASSVLSRQNNTVEANGGGEAFTGPFDPK